MEPEVNFSPNAIVVLKRRYLKKNSKGDVIETPKEMLKRVAIAIAAVEKKYKSNVNFADKIEKEIFNMMAKLEFMPNSPTLMNAGKNLGQLSACFVVPVDDSMESIFDAIKSTALIHKTGGGTGFSFSRLRPKNSVVKSTGGVASGPISFMKVFDAATQAVKQGGTRRGANMGILRVDHPDILEFIHCKEKEGEISNFNISVAVTDDFMEHVFKGEKYNLIDPRTKEIKGELDARKVFDLIALYAHRNGEPGIVFIDRVNESNLVPHLGKIESTNPCVTADTWVMSAKGPEKVKDLIGKRFVAVVNGENWFSSDSGFFETGIKEIYRLKTTEGFEVCLTKEHPVLKVKKADRYRAETEWVEAGSLKHNDRVILNNHSKVNNWEGKYTKEEGYLVGLLLGDGTIKKDKVVLSSWGQSDGPKAVRALAYKCANSFHHRIDFRGWIGVKERDEYCLSTAYIKNLAQSLGLESGKKEVTEEIEKASSDFYKGFLKGIFDADGSVQGNQRKGVSIRLAQSNLGVLKAVQRMLLRLGIFSRIYVNRRKKELSMLPDGKGGSREYSIKPQHELVISKRNIFSFFEKVGFGDSGKMGKLRDAIENYKRKMNKELFIATVDEVVLDKKERVFDVNIPGINAFDANGFYVHNCGEQPLLPYESCNLGSINLAKMLKEDGDKFVIDWDKLKSVTKLSTRFLDNVIDANKFPIPQIKENTLRTRKIGLGIMGWATMLGFLGIPYNSEEAIELAKRVMEVIYESAKEESISLAKERGVFPAWKRSVWENRGIRIRNATLTTIAPTGSISIIAGPTSTGIEPVYSLCYFRNVLDGERLLEVDPAFEYIARKRGFYSDDLMNRIASGESIQYMKEVPDDVKRVFVTALDIDTVWHVKMQAAFQDYTDNAVSKTINLPNEAAVNDVKEVYTLAYKLGCKGITVYRDGSRQEQVLTLNKKNDDREKEQKDVYPYPRPRPQVTIGTTTKVATGCGNLYITVNQNEDGDFVEVFTQMGKAGGCAASQLEAIGRLVSLALRGGIDPKVIIEQLKGIRCPSPSWANGKKIFSCADALSRVLEKRIVDQKEMIKVGVTAQKKKAATLVKSKHFDNSLNNIVGVCPDCGSALRHQEGCLVCDACGYSKC